MNGPQLTDLYDRLAAQLGDPSLTRFQLIDMATVLMLVRRDLDREIDVRDGTAIAALTAHLHWMRGHAHDASVAELRSHLAAAIDVTGHVLVHTVGQPFPENCRLLERERAHV